MSRGALGEDELLAMAARRLPHRRPELFFEFLRRGYELVRLPGASPRHASAARVAKLALGCIITAIDDLADRPDRFDVRALERASTLLLSPEQLFAPESELECLLVTLRDEMARRIRTLPGHRRLARLLAFDLAQIVRANDYHQLLTELPTLGNRIEMQTFGPYNMGMIAAHMMDLMTIDAYPVEHLGADREVFVRGQRYGRICNMLVTYERERREGDVTSELLNPHAGLVTRAELLAEQAELLRRIEAATGTSFPVAAYAASLRDLRRLHGELEGRL